MKTDGKKQARSAKKSQREAAARPAQRSSRFAGALLGEWKRLGLPHAGERVVVAVSGGADSMALLLALHELSASGCLDLHTVVAHLDHGLRGEESSADALWVEETARRLGLEVELGRAEVKRRAAGSLDNLEQAARRARYEFLAETATKAGARLVLTGHTMDDQAETVLMRLMRGSGADGLSGMEAVRPLSEGSEILLVRPLLGWARRAETEKYCRGRKVEFRVDSMNEDERFVRVRVRRKLLPLLETFNPKVVESLARTAALLRDEASVLNAAAEWVLKSATEEQQSEEKEKSPSTRTALRVDVLRLAAAPIRRRALRLWLARGRGDLRRLEMVHLLGVEKLLAGERGGRVAELPGGAFVERRRGHLRLHFKESLQQKARV